MIKTYKANTHISINVVLPNEKNMRISFSALSNGNSVYRTDNEDVQKALEKHYRFGKLFRLIGEEECGKEAKPTGPKKTKVEDAGFVTEEENGAGNEAETTSEDSNVRIVKVSDIATAKDYLAEHFGVSRTAMRSAKAISEQAAAHGIEFDGI